MTALSRKWSTTDPPDVSNRAPRCVFCGTVAGLVIALTAFFIGSTYYVAANELCTTSCTALGSFLTVVLSQPVAFVGAIIGATCGAIYACVVYRRKRQGKTS